MEINVGGKVKIEDTSGVLFCPYADDGNGETVTIAQRGKRHVVFIDYLIENLYRLKNMRKIEQRR